MIKLPRLTNLLLLLVSTLVSLLIFELAYRFFIFGWNSFSRKQLNSVHPLGVSGLVQPAANPEIVYELKPNSRTRFKLTPFETNSNGLRDKEYAIPKPDRSFRVGVVGDSFTMGTGLRIEDTYHTLLEERLNQEQDDVVYEFINFGVAGYYFRQYLAILTSKVKKYDVDLVLIGFCPVNDYKIPPQRIFEVAYKVKKTTYPFVTSFVLKRLKVHALRLIEYDKTKPHGTVLSKAEEKYVSGIIAKMSSFSKNNDIPIVIVHLSHAPDGRYSKAAKILEGLVFKNDLYFIDVSPAFKNKNFREYIIYQIDKHPNAKANELFADQIYDYLIETRLLENI